MVIVGAFGVVTGVPDTATELAPDPALLTARSVIEYAVPFVSAVSANVVLLPRVNPGSVASEVHAPEPMRYS